MAGEAISIVSIASGATVAVAVPYINARFERVRLRQQDHSLRLDELRQRLDDAMTALAASEDAADHAEVAVELAQRRHATADDRAKAADALLVLSTANDLAGRSEHLIQIRVGLAHAAATAYNAALKSLRDMERELDDILAGGPSADVPDAYAEAVREVADIRARYEEAKSTFISAASALIGPA